MRCSIGGQLGRSNAHAEGCDLRVIHVRIMRQDQWSVSMVGLPASIKQISNVLKMTGGIGLLVLSVQHLAIPARASADKVFDTCTEAQIGQVVSRWWDSVLCQWQPGEIWMGPTDKPRLPKAIKHLRRHIRAVRESALPKWIHTYRE